MNLTQLRRRIPKKTTRKQKLFSSFQSVEHNLKTRVRAKSKKRGNQTERKEGVKGETYYLVLALHVSRVSTVSSEYGQLLYPFPCTRERYIKIENGHPVLRRVTQPRRAKGGPLDNAVRFSRKYPTVCTRVSYRSSRVRLHAYHQPSLSFYVLPLLTISCLKQIAPGFTLPHVQLKDRIIPTSLQLQLFEIGSRTLQREGESTGNSRNRQEGVVLNKIVTYSIKSRFQGPS